MLEVTAHVEGLAEVMQMLRMFPPRLQEKAVRPALRKAGVAVQRRAASYAPYLTGALSGGLRAFVKTRNIPRGSVVVRVVPTKKNYYARMRLDGKGPVKKVSPKTYSQWMEYGFIHKRTGRHVPGQHFMEHAAIAEFENSQNILVREIQANIHKLAGGA